MLGTFPRSGVTAIQWKRQTGVAANGDPTFPTNPVPLPLAALDVAKGAVGAIAFGSFTSPNWETSEQFIPAIGTRTGVPAVQGPNTLYFTLILPAGSAPAGGWPVVIFGHGFTDSKQGAPLAVASTFASHGLATIAINVVGHGGGAAGTLTIVRTSGDPVIIPDGGRGIDQDGNGTIDSTEGSSARPPRVIIGNRDGLRQTVADLMQLVRVIETGGIPGLSHRRIYYAGQSFGGIYGVKLLALEDSIRAGVPNVPGGAIIEIARLSPSFRPLVGIALASRVPALLNAGPLAPPAWGFNENVPLRDVPPVINTVPGAMAIQEVLDNTEWVSQSGNPVAYAPHLRKRPLHETDPGPVIIQFAKGDMTVPNPTASAIIRAGELTDRTSYFRNDLVRAAIPTAPANPHTFLTAIGTAAVVQALQAQTQIAIFFENDGAVVVDPDGDGATGTFFEVPIAGPLPEVLNF
jgi:dienelactone hydrolase